MNKFSVRIGNSIKLDIVWLYEISVIILPILDNYLLLPIRFSAITYSFGLLLFMLHVIEGHTSGILELKHTVYFMYVLLITLVMIALYDLGGFSYSFPRIGTFVLAFVNFYIFAYKVWDFEKGFKVYKFLCILCSMIVILQFLSGLMGGGFTVMIPGIQTAGGSGLTDGYIRSQLSTNRYSSFFLEPAHQAQYTLPCAAILLFNDIENKQNRRDNIIAALLITVGIIATTSMLGILGAAVLWLYYIVILIQKGKLKGISKLIGLLPVITVVFCFLMQQEVIRVQFLKKVTSFNSGNIVTSSSLYVRLFYGWDCFKDLSLFHKLFGIGYYNSSVYLAKFGIGLRFVDAESVGYMSGLSEMFCELGIIGVALNLSILIFPAIKCKNKIAQSLLLCWLIIMLTAGAFDRISSLLPLTFMLSCVYREKKGNPVIIP